MTVQTNGIHTEATKPGRPPLDAAGQLQSITITLTAEDLALLDEVGKGNYSEGVRLAVRTLRAQRAELQRIMARLEADPSNVVPHDELQRRLAVKSEAHLLEEVRTKKAVPHVLAP